MTFEKPTFVKPDTNVINGLDYSEIYIGGIRIGSLTKTKHVVLYGEHKDKERVSYTYDLEVMYNQYQFKESERKQIHTVIEIEYTKAIFHVLGSVGKVDVDKWKVLIDERDLKRTEKLKREFTPISEMTIKE